MLRIPRFAGLLGLSIGLMTGCTANAAHPGDAAGSPPSATSGPWTAVLQVLVGTDGNAREVEIIQASGRPDLDKAAVAAAQKWHFNPRIRNGVAVESYARVPVTFSPNPPPAAP